jgi:hypothetical protein
MSFTVDAGNGEGLFCFFEDDGDTGYFYYHEPDGAGIIDHLHIYSHPMELGTRKRDVQVVWSNDLTKCGVKIWGSFYGIFDLASSTKMGILVKNKNTKSITDPRLLNGF